jgi:uncharacterized protein YcbK (DUF882 family)|tara:strand:- start:148946 stop:149548 length:603 start_codon:yes stop_codon:yes gene_type:complete
VQVNNAVIANASDTQPEVSRRRFLKTSLIAATVASSNIIMPKAALAVPHGEGSLCELSFRNLHTGEKFDGAYRVGNKYLLGALNEVNTVLRDFRTGDVYPMDPQLMDIIYTMQKLSGAQGRDVEIISGYRSPKTNAMLRGRSSGVAKKSFHMKGQAIDLRIPGISTARLRDIAKSLKTGGVGYYASSNFVHIDTGTVRSW